MIRQLNLMLKRISKEKMLDGKAHTILQYVTAFHKKQGIIYNFNKVLHNKLIFCYIYLHIYMLQ